jgi:hypothetical protein
MTLDKENNVNIVILYCYNLTLYKVIIQIKTIKSDDLLSLILVN